MSNPKRPFEQPGRSGHWGFLWLACSFFCSSAFSQAWSASLNDVTAIPHINSAGQEGYRAFLAAEPHRAFAIAPGGAWAWSAEQDNPDAAREQAINTCQQHTQQRCVAYAVGNQVVFDARRWAQGWRPYATKAQAHRAPLGTQRGQRFPNLRLTSPQGQPVNLSSLKGKVVVLHFWGSWCPSCRHELPQFSQLQKDFAKDAATQRDLVFITTQVRESAETARTYLRQQGLPLALHDSGVTGGKNVHFLTASGEKLPDRNIAPVFPATFVLDRHGIVVFSLRGSAADWRQYTPLLKDLLSAQR